MFINTSSFWICWDRSNTIANIYTSLALLQNPQNASSPRQHVSTASPLEYEKLSPSSLLKGMCVNTCAFVCVLRTHKPLVVFYEYTPISARVSTQAAGIHDSVIKTNSIMMDTSHTGIFMFMQGFQNWQACISPKCISLLLQIACSLSYCVEIWF